MRLTDEQDEMCLHIPREPTPEQLADDGRADGIPLVTLEEIKRRDKQRLSEMARLGEPKSRCGRGMKMCVRIVGTSEVLVGIAEIAARLDASYDTIHRLMRGEKVPKLKGIKLKKLPYDLVARW